VIRNLNNSEDKEISNDEFKITMTRIINKIKETMYKQLNAHKDDTSN
jgi:hypothetical protein